MHNKWSCHFKVKLWLLTTLKIFWWKISPVFSGGFQIQTAIVEKQTVLNLTPQVYKPFSENPVSFKRSTVIQKENSKYSLTEFCIFRSQFSLVERGSKWLTYGTLGNIISAIDSISSTFQLLSYDFCPVSKSILHCLNVIRRRSNARCDNLTCQISVLPPKVRVFKRKTVVVPQTICSSNREAE